MTGYYNTENPAYIDACIYGNRFPISYRQHEEDLEELVKCVIDVDTRTLTEEEEGALYGDLDDIYISDDYEDLYDEVGFDVELVALPELEGTEQYGLIKIRGYVPELTYDEICNVLDRYNVKWKG